MGSLQRWHYEENPGETNGDIWRVADEDDNIVGAYDDESAAQYVVRSHNAMLEKHRSGWRF